MAKTNKTKLYACWWLAHSGKTEVEISEELQLDISVVEQYIKEMPVSDQSVNKPSHKSLMITQTSGKGTNSVAIMTKQASELGDELKKNHVPPRSNTGIFRPRS